MTDEEKQLLNKLGECFNEFDKLEVIYPADKLDFVFHVHALQNIVLSRQSMRELNQFKDEVSPANKTSA